MSTDKSRSINPPLPLSADPQPDMGALEIRRNFCIYIYIYYIKYVSSLHSVFASARLRRTVQRCFTSILYWMISELNVCLRVVDDGVHPCVHHILHSMIHTILYSCKYNSRYPVLSIKYYKLFYSFVHQNLHCSTQRTQNPRAGRLQTLPLWKSAV